MDYKTIFINNYVINLVELQELTAKLRLHQNKYYSDVNNKSLHLEEIKKLNSEIDKLLISINNNQLEKNSLCRSIEIYTKEQKRIKATSESIQEIITRAKNRCLEREKIISGC